MTKQPSIAEAITRVSRHIRRFSDIMVQDTLRELTRAEIGAHKAKVESLCDELDALARRSESEDVRLQDFEAVRNRLYSVNAIAPLGHLNAVQYAFINLEAL
jgi:hypothetical protein